VNLPSVVFFFFLNHLMCEFLFELKRVVMFSRNFHSLSSKFGFFKDLATCVCVCDIVFSLCLILQGYS
jgi:hypothetical protein